MMAAAPNCFKASFSPRYRFSSAAIFPCARLIGAYAGEIGHTQFLPSS
jgi:membrane-bound lytic murein transglycosylase B